jgi:Rrf2 family cysteine metabolism transcriptional repressor
MKFSTKSTYGLKAIVNLAKHPKIDRVPLHVIATEENLSLGYLERIFSQLKDSKIVKADKGANGGYQLAKNPSQISAWEIINSLEGGQDLFYCLEKSGKVYCSKSCKCDANYALLKVRQTLDDSLKKLKLSDLVTAHNA